MESFNSNNINTSCPLSLSWTQSSINNEQPRLIVCIVASIIHSIFWLQLVFCPSIRQKSMQWIYAYLITDILLLFRFFLIYIVYTTSTACEPNKAWFLFMCYFEIIGDNYPNILEVYILLALNICRYAQIAYNRNVYATNRRLLIISHFLIYFAPLLSLFVQFITGWAQIEPFTNDVCDVLYTNAYIQIFNIIAAFALPILLNILVIYASVRHVRLTSALRRAQHHVSAREKYNRSLVIQFLAFYTIWITFWAPNVIVDQLTNGENDITIVVVLLNFIGIALNPIIIGALDVRFWKAWRKVWLDVKHKYFRSTARQVTPIITAVTIPRMRTQNETAL